MFILQQISTNIVLAHLDIVSGVPLKAVDEALVLLLEIPLGKLQ